METICTLLTILFCLSANAQIDHNEWYLAGDDVFQRSKMNDTIFLEKKCAAERNQSYSTMNFAANNCIQIGAFRRKPWFEKRKIRYDCASERGPVFTGTYEMNAEKTEITVTAKYECSSCMYEEQGFVKKYHIYKEKNKTVQLILIEFISYCDDRVNMPIWSIKEP